MISAFVIAGGRSTRMGRDKALLRLGDAGPTMLECAIELTRAVTEDVRIVGQKDVLNSAIPQFANSALEDIFSGQGPLAGIHAALRASASELNLMLAVDTPFIEARFLRYIVEQAESGGAIVTVPVTAERPQMNADQRRSKTNQSQMNTDKHRSHKGNSDQPSFTITGEQSNSPNADQSSSVLISGEKNLPVSDQCSSVLIPGQYQPLCAVYRREFADVAEAALRAGRNNIVPLFAQVSTRAITEDELRQLAFDPRMFDNLNTPEEWEEACRRLRKL